MQYTVYIAVRVEISVVSLSRMEGQSGCEMVKWYVLRSEQNLTLESENDKEDID